MSTVELELPETLSATLPNKRKVTRLETNAIAKRDEAKKYIVKNSAQYNGAAEFALDIKAMEKLVEDLYGEHVDAAHKLHKGLTSARKLLLDPLTEARTLIQRAMSDYDREQRRKQDEKDRAEAQAVRDQEIKDAKKTKAPAREVAALKAAPLEVFKSEAPTPKVAGVVTKRIINWELVDATKVPRQFLIVDEAAIRAYIKLHGEECLSKPVAGLKFSLDVQTQIRG